MIYIFFMILSISRAEPTALQIKCDKILEEVKQICPKIPKKNVCLFLENTSQAQKIRIARDLLEVKVNLGMNLQQKLKANMSHDDYALIITEVARCYEPRVDFWKAVIEDKANSELAALLKEDLTNTSYPSTVLTALVDTSFLRKSIQSGFLQVKDKEGSNRKLLEIHKMLTAESIAFQDRRQKKFDSLSYIQKGMLYIKAAYLKVFDSEFDSTHILIEPFEDLTSNIKATNAARQEFIEIIR